MGDGAKYVDGAAEEIDAALGGIYVTPISIDIEANPEQRPAFLLLKKINWLLASGRLVLDLAAPGENADLHAYGRRMLDEGLALLGQVAAREIVLTGAELIPPPPGEEDSPTGPTIHNEDDVSLVESFYTRHNPYTMPVPSLRPPEPYGNVRL
jgi:hypothetical protein